MYQMETGILKEFLQVFMISEYLAVTKVPIVLEVIVLFPALSAYAGLCAVSLKLPT